MYSQDMTQIRAGLVNYIGAFTKSVPFEGKAGKQEIAAVLIEEALKLAKDEDNKIDLYIMKPMIRGMILILEQRIEELSKLPKEIAKEQQEVYKSIIDFFNSLLLKIN